MGRRSTEWQRLEISSRKLNTRGIFHAKMDTIKDRNGMDLTEAEDFNKRCQEYMEKLQNILMTVITRMV